MKTYCPTWRRRTVSARQPIPYLAEIAGTVPNPQWKLDTLNDYWATGDAVNLAIGQGYLLATPIQMANVYATIANGGTLLQPFIVEFTRDSDGNQTRVGKRKVLHTLSLSKAEIAELQSALRDQTSNGDGVGSAKVFGDFGWPIAGKTGTAENQSNKLGKPHSWFAAFGPYGKRATIASIVMIESSGEGVTFAAPVTRQIYEAYLQSNLANS
jgi:penicillin-binding protein 2